MKTTALFISLLVVLTLSAPSSARIRNVPNDFQTIQEAIDSSRARDTILVQPGVYEENVVIRRQLTLASQFALDGDERHIEATVIDGGHNNPAVAVERTGVGTVAIKGFTLCNGRGHQGRGGGGVYALNSNLTLEYLDVRDNDGGADVGGDGGGGVFFLGDGDPVTNSIIMRNVVVRRNTVENWGAVSIWFAHAALTDVVIDSNSSNRSGGLHFARGDLALTRVAITNNYGPQVSALTLDFDGPAEREELELICENVTVAGNNGGRSAVSCNLFDSDARLTNCLFYNNSSDWYYFTGGDIHVGYSLFPGGRDGFMTYRSEGGTDWSEGNIDSDPLFVNPDNGDYHLSENSPCIDAGDPDSPPDRDGTRSDMGAYFFNQNDPPEVIHQIGVVTVDEDCGLDAIADLDTIFADPNGDTLTYSVFGQEQLGLSVNEEGVLSIEPALNFNGDSLMVVVSAHDASDSAAVRFLVTVSTVNDPPTSFELVAPADSIHFRFSEDYPTPYPFYWTRSSDPDGNQDMRYLFRIECQFEEYNQIVEVPAEADSFYYQLGPMPSTVEFAWRVQAISGDDTADCVQSFHFWIEGFNDVAPIGGHPSKFAIHSLSPNPFNSSTTIRFSVGQVSKPVRLAVYGLDGRLVQELWTGRDTHSSTEHSVVWNAEGLPGGVYLVRLESGNKTQTIKAVLMK